MKLDPADVQLFFDLMLPLQWYVSQQAELLPDIKTFEDYTDSSMDDKIIVRDYLFDHPELIDQFIQDNPNNLETEKLSLIAPWKNFIHGDFFIERLLKKYSIFIDDKENVYAVLGLMEGLDAFMDKRNLPVRVKTILLPFKGKIVYDGFFRWYRMFFGGGIKSSLKQTYLIAKDNNAIIDTLEQGALTSQKKGKKARKSSSSDQDWGPLLDELAEKAKKLRGGGGQPATYSPIFSLVRTSIELAQLATADSPDIDKLFKKGARLDTLLQQVEKALIRYE